MQPPQDDHLGNHLHSTLQDLQGKTHHDNHTAISRNSLRDKHHHNQSRDHRTFALILLTFTMALLGIGFAIKKAIFFTTISAYVRLLFQQHWALVVL
jgi:hypothetical protein